MRHISTILHNKYNWICETKQVIAAFPYKWKTELKSDVSIRTCVNIKRNILELCYENKHADINSIDNKQLYNIIKRKRVIESSGLNYWETSKIYDIQKIKKIIKYHVFFY